MPSLDLDLYLLEGDPVAVTRAGARRRAVPGDDTDVLLDAPFRLIVPFDYGVRRRDPSQLVAAEDRRERVNP